MSSLADRPSIAAARVAQLLERCFGLDPARVELRALPSYIDRNFEVRDGDTRYVLKVAHASTTRAQMELECEAMDALAAASLDFATPRVVGGVREEDGREEDGRGRGRLVEVVGDDGQRHVARLVTHVPGPLLADAGRPSDAMLRAIGEQLAAADLALAAVTHPERTRALSWDLARAGWVADALGLIASPPRRAWVEQALLQYRALVAPALSAGALPRAVIHNDANDYNLTVDVGRERLAGLFDFGDLVETCRVFEPVIAATYAAFHRPDDPFAAIAAVVAGYDRGLGADGLQTLELELVPELVAMRLATSVVSSAQAAAADPDHHYASVSEAGAWRLLEQLVTRSRVELGARVRAACGRSEPGAGGRSRDEAALLEARRRVLGANLSVAYDAPLQMVRGHMQHLFDETGRAYLDCVNNVCHVGHCHPRVVAAACEQIATLNTNTRYLHPGIVDYAEALSATMPAGLDVVFMVCSGSEANELALRLARAATGREAFAVLDHAYHGNTGALVGLSPYKFAGPGGGGQPAGVHVLAAPDPYRAPESRDGRAFAERSVGRELDALARSGDGVAGLLAESLLGCGGQIVPPPGYLARAFELVRAHGGVAIADEVQVGFGRVGPCMWGFAAQGARPDIVTLGKPIGNGHPMGAVVTTRAIADAFANGMEYFNTFGGNPVSCAVGMAVLDVLADEGLADRAVETGERLLAGFRAMGERLPIIADVRGLGLFVGVELVGPQRVAAAAEARAVVEACRREGVLLSVDGPRHNVIKIKPPLVFDAVDAGLLLSAVERALVGLSLS